MLYVIECYLNTSAQLAHLLVVGSVERASQHFVCHIYAYESEQTRNAYQCIDFCAVSNTADLDFEIAVNLAGGVIECHFLSVILLRKTPYRFVLRCKFNTNYLIHKIFLQKNSIFLLFFNFSSYFF